MKKQPTVWIVQVSDKPVEAARKYGKIETLILQPYHHPDDEASAVSFIQGKLAAEMEDGDYLLLLGHVSYCGVALHAALNKHARAKVLVYDRKSADYRVQTVFHEIV